MAGKAPCTRYFHLVSLWEYRYIFQLFFPTGGRTAQPGTMTLPPVPRRVRLYVTVALSRPFATQCGRRGPKGERTQPPENITMNENPAACGECPEGRVKDPVGRCVMPEVTFASFILSLNTSALYHMGELPHPETGRKIVDRELAKHTIDTLALLAEKTRGNLDPNEQELLTRILYELKMRFVKLG